MEDILRQKKYPIRTIPILVSIIKWSLYTIPFLFEIVIPVINKQPVKFEGVKLQILISLLSLFFFVESLQGYYCNKISGRGGPFTRSEQPGSFWFYVIAYLVFGLLMFIAAMQ